MAKVTRKFNVKRKPEAVIDYISDVEHHPAFMTGNAEPTVAYRPDGQLHLGHGRSADRRDRGRGHANRIEGTARGKQTGRQRRPRSR